MTKYRIADVRIGGRYHRWLVVAKLKRYQGQRGCFLCRCECGREKAVKYSHLLAGRSCSCGCLRTELLIKRARTHGRSNTPEYESWTGMKNRCLNSNEERYHDYGGRGVTVCERWLTSFENFLADMGPKPSREHSLDRFPNNDGNYEPSNCRWATPEQQANNRRASVFLGSRTVAQWTRMLHFKKWTLRNRLNAGWTMGKALSTPERGQRAITQSWGLQ